MIGFSEIAQRHWRDPSFNLLYFGPDCDRWKAIREVAEKLPGHANIVQADQLSKDKGVTRETLNSKRNRESLVVIMDLVGQGERELQDKCSRIRRPWPSSDTDSLSRDWIAFALTVDREWVITFQTFVQMVGDNLGDTGGLEKCLTTLRQWLGQKGPPVGPIDLRINMPKMPSLLIRDMGHDYLAILGRPYDVELKACGLWDAQLEIEFWINVLRNVLVFPCTDSPNRDLPGDKGEINRLCFGRPCRFLVPSEMKLDVRVDWTEGDDYSVYQSPDDAVRLQKEWANDGIQVVLICSGPEASAQLGIEAPCLWVCDPEVRLTWDQWRRAFAENVLGSFATKEFATILNTAKKRSMWRALGTRPMMNAIDRIIDLLSQTYAGIDGRPDFLGKASFLEIVYKGLARMWCARGLYFAVS
jgi:hypothetical protein